jgi:hypothetical protein
MNLRNLAARSAILQSLALITGMVIWMVILPGQGMDMNQMNNGTYMGQFMATHSSTLIVSHFFNWVIGATGFVVAMALAQKFSKSQPWSSTVIRGTGYISATCFALAGAIGIFAMHNGAREYALNAANGIQLVLATGLISWAAENCGWALTGFVILNAALASRRTNAFAGWVNWTGMIAGTLYIGSAILTAVSPDMWMLGMIGGIFAIIFNVGIARSFMRMDQNELNFAPQGN